MGCTASIPSATLTRPPATPATPAAPAAPKFADEILELCSATAQAERLEEQYKIACHDVIIAIKTVIREAATDNERFVVFSSPSGEVYFARNRGVFMLKYTPFNRVRAAVIAEFRDFDVVFNAHELRISWEITATIKIVLLQLPTHTLAPKIIEFVHGL